MHTTFLKLPLAISVILVPCGTQAELTDGLVARYDLNGNAADSSGYRNDGTVMGATPSPDRFGTPNSAYFFDGIDDYIRIPESTAFDSPAFSISLWFRSASFPAEAGMLISKGQNNFEIHTTQEEFIAPRAIKFLPRFVAHGVTMDWYAPANTNALHEWTHIVGVYNPGTEIRFYVNGVDMPLKGPSDLRNASDNLLDARLGMRSDNTLPFHGEIDDVRIYARVLSADEISQLVVPKVDRLPIPDAKMRAATIELVKYLYKKDFEQALRSEQKIALARKLLEEGLSTTDDNAGRYVLLQIACTLAAENGNMDTALEAIEQINAEYEIDKLAVMGESLKSLAMAVRSKQQHEMLTLRISVVMREAIDEDRYDIAKSLAQLALVSARKSKDIALSRQTVAQLKEVEVLATEFAAVQTARTMLAAKPTDPAANLTVGKFYCFVKRDWSIGIPMLALSNEPELKSLADIELEVPSQPGDLVRLGDGWWSQALKADGRQKQNIEMRARDWYLQALPDLSGLTAARIQKRLDELDPLVTP